MDAIAPVRPATTAPAIKEHEFRRIRDLLHELAGIDLGAEKQALVAGRLERRLRALKLRSYAEYAELVLQPDQSAELQTAIDLLTTNETYFFREPAHFRFLHEWVKATDCPGKRWRIWSAASSTGEEAYSIAMTLDDAISGERLEVLGSDISMRVLERARRGHYPIGRLEHLPPEYLKRYCLKGTGAQEGTLLIQRTLRGRVEFRQVNLIQPLPEIGVFDVVFLRNALIYFNAAGKRAILRSVLTKLAVGGHLFVSHSESLHGIVEGVIPVRPGIYRKPERAT